MVAKVSRTLPRVVTTRGAFSTTLTSSTSVLDTSMTTFISVFSPDFTSRSLWMTVRSLGAETFSSYFPTGIASSAKWPSGLLYARRPVFSCTLTPDSGFPPWSNT